MHLQSNTNATEAQSHKYSEDAVHLQEELLRSHHQLQMLFEISSAIHSSPRLEDVLQQALMAILHTFNFKMGAIYLATEVVEERWLFHLAAQYGFSSPLGQPLVDAIRHLSLSTRQVEPFSNNKPVRWFTPEQVAFPELRERMCQEQITQIICIPLFTQKVVLGLLYVTNDGPLQIGPDQSEFLTTIGQQIGVAIENAQLFDSIQRAKSELEISFDAIQHSIFIIDSRRRILRINRTSESVYGATGELIGKTYTSVLYGQDEPHAECPVLECMRKSQPVQRKGAHPRWGGFYHYYAFPVLNLSGALERVVYYEKDVTEARKLEERLQQSEKLKALGTLAAGMAHEIRNPLATINFNTQMLQRELELNGPQEQMFTDMLSEIKKIDRIVQQVLHFARPREPQFLPHQLNEVVKYCLDLSKVHLRKANIEVQLELSEKLPCITMDFNQISQVVVNLLINAIEAMPDGGRLSLRTSRQRDSSTLVLEISDTGMGILEEDRGRIFDPFFTRKPDGTGLGLSITRQILEKHGAYIEMESSPGEGATFRVSFPVLSEPLTSLLPDSGAASKRS